MQPSDDVQGRVEVPDDVCARVLVEEGELVGRRVLVRVEDHAGAHVEGQGEVELEDVAEDDEILPAIPPDVEDAPEHIVVVGSAQEHGSVQAGDPHALGDVGIPVVAHDVLLGVSVDAPGEPLERPVVHRHRRGEHCVAATEGADLRPDVVRGGVRHDVAAEAPHCLQEVERALPEHDPRLRVVVLVEDAIEEAGPCVRILGEHAEVAQDQLRDGHDPQVRVHRRGRDDEAVVLPAVSLWVDLALETIREREHVEHVRVADGGEVGEVAVAEGNTLLLRVRQGSVKVQNEHDASWLLGERTLASFCAKINPGPERYPSGVTRLHLL